MASRCSAEVLSGRYRLDGLLGSGGAADVHRGFDLRLRRPVAVKVFRPGTGVDIEETLRSEAVILARLHHPGVVTAYDAGQHNGRAFLVMQLIEGSTLRNVITEGPLSPEATAALGADLAQALAHAHEAGIVHRDVKPGNIMLDACRRPHLTDFGISRLLDATTRTATGTLTGTAAYLSPEQVRGQSVGRPADIYALGLVLLECLTGRLEYDGVPLEAAIARLHRQPVLPDCLPERLADLLRDMTTLDDQARPTARDCARTLTAVADTAGFSAGPMAQATSLIASHGQLQTADHTDANALSDEDRTASLLTPARGRTLVLGATAALAAVMATTLAVTDNSAPQGNDRSGSRAASAPNVQTDPPGSTGHGEATTPSTATPPSDHSPSIGALPTDAPGQSLQPASHDLNHKRAVDAATHTSAAKTTQTTPRDTDTPAAATQGGTTTETPHRPPGQAKKSETAEDKAQQKKAKKTATER
ncbi:protein kinase [Streptomyces sp. NPDC060000]|uniref:serine/threonine-protein kinase n=1 Tax=Streptomyces sp. NPDC060000 TaxID=3347031 RepID=UPI003694049B